MENFLPNKAFYILNFYYPSPFGLLYSIDKKEFRALGLQLNKIEASKDGFQRVVAIIIFTFLIYA